MEPLISFALTIGSGVLVSVITLLLAEYQRARQEARSEKRCREAILTAIRAELRWNRTANLNDLDVTNAHILVGALTTVAFERHGADLSTIVPDSIKSVFEHYAQVGKTRESIRSFAGSSSSTANDKTREQWIEICNDIRVQVANTATKALDAFKEPLSTYESNPQG